MPKKLKVDENAVLKKLPPGLIDNLPADDQEAIIAIVGKPPFNCVQRPPPSCVKNRPNSVPTKSKFGSALSSATTSREASITRFARRLAIFDSFATIARNHGRSCAPRRNVFRFHQAFRAASWTTSSVRNGTLLETTPCDPSDQYDRWHQQ